MILLIYQSTDENEKFTYSNPVVKSLQEKFPPSSIFHIDSYSDHSLFSYSEKLLREEDRVLFIILNKKEGEIPKKTGGLIQASLKNDHVKMLSLYSNALIEKVNDVEVYQDEDELVRRVNELVSSH